MAEVRCCSPLFGWRYIRGSTIRAPFSRSARVWSGGAPMRLGGRFKVTGTGGRAVSPPTKRSRPTRVFSLSGERLWTGPGTRNLVATGCTSGWAGHRRPIVVGAGPARSATGVACSCRGAASERSCSSGVAPGRAGSQGGAPQKDRRSKCWQARNTLQIASRTTFVQAPLGALCTGRGERAMPSMGKGDSESRPIEVSHIPRRTLWRTAAAAGCRQAGRGGQALGALLLAPQWRGRGGERRPAVAASRER